MKSGYNKCMKKTSSRSLAFFFVLFVFYAGVGCGPELIAPATPASSPSPTQIFMMMQNSGSIAIPYWIFMVNLFLGYILDFVTTLVFVPFSILFFKNFYLDLKSSKKK